MAKFRSEHDKYEGMPGIKCEDFDLVSGEQVFRTKQADKEGCDIHNVLRRIEQGSLLPDLVKSDPRYGDFSMARDYRESMEIVLNAQQQFMALPAATRERFKNDPAQMLAFCEDKKNVEEAIKLGLILPRKPATDPGATQPPAGQSAAAAPKPEA